MRTVSRMDEMHSSLSRRGNRDGLVFTHPSEFPFLIDQYQNSWPRNWNQRMQHHSHHRLSLPLFCSTFSCILSSFSNGWIHPHPLPICRTFPVLHGGRKKESCSSASLCFPFALPLFRFLFSEYYYHHLSDKFASILAFLVYCWLCGPLSHIQE